MSSNRTKPTGEWTDEHLEECRKLGIPPNAHPELLEAPAAPYPVGQEIPLKLREKTPLVVVDKKRRGKK